MAVKSFEKYVKQLTNELEDLITEYDFEQYDFHSIRTTLLNYIEKNYPDYNNYFKSDYIMMLVELFAYHTEMLAYRMDVNMNEVYLSTAKNRRNVIKIADMLGYKFSRITPSVGMIKIDMVKSNIIKKNISENNLNDLIHNTAGEITFQHIPIVNSVFDNRLDTIFKNFTGDEFLNTINNILTKLTNFDNIDGIKERKIIENGIEFYERSIIIDELETRFNANINTQLKYLSGSHMFEVQSLKCDNELYFMTNNTEDALSYKSDGNSLYNNIISTGVEIVIKYDKSETVIDKQIYFYLPLVQGASFKKQITNVSGNKNFSYLLQEANIYQNNMIVRQSNNKGEFLRELVQVDDINNSTVKNGFEVNNTPDGFIELVFGNGNNVDILKSEYRTDLYYRKSPDNSPESLNIPKTFLQAIPVTIPYFDNTTNAFTTLTFDLEYMDTIHTVYGNPAESNDQIKQMARRLKSVQNRFVTIDDYSIAGFLHPRVKYSTALLRSYIGKNSSRIDGNYIDVYFSKEDREIKIYKIDTTKILIYIPDALFTPSTSIELDYIKLISSDRKFYFRIFNEEEINPNEWYKYSKELLDDTNKGKIIEIVNEKKDIDKTINISESILKSVLSIPFDISYKITNIINGIEIMIDIDAHAFNYDTFKEATISNKNEIINYFNNIIKTTDFTDMIMSGSNNNINLNLIYDFEIVDESIFNDSLVWRHYKSDDIFINPSKSNIVEIYVSGFKKDLKRNIEMHYNLSENELFTLQKNIESRKMISDIVQIYNAKTYPIETHLNIKKTKTAKISNELLLNKINVSLNKFYDVNNLKFGYHFYSSQLIEHLHRDIYEIESVELVYENGVSKTPISTLQILSDKISTTQIVEATQRINNVEEPIRKINIY